jgi:hypothetical protein
VAAAVAGTVATGASANPQAFRDWSASSDQGWKGSRVTVDNPDSSQATVNSGNFFDAAAEADDRGLNLIQQGVTYEYNAAEGPSCNLGSSGPKLYYFTEIIVSGLAACYQNGTATFSTSHLQTVVRGSNGNWAAYRDGNPTGVTTNWAPSCGGNACFLSAFAEAHVLGAGKWAAKFAGSGNTVWQFWNGAMWNPINNADLNAPSPPWTPSGPFPGGIWSLNYSH